MVLQRKFTTRSNNAQLKIKPTRRKYQYSIENNNHLTNFNIGINQLKIILITQNK